MQAHIISLHTLSTYGLDQKIKKMNVVMLLIKLKGLKHRLT